MNVENAAQKYPVSFSLLSSFRRFFLQSQGEVHYIGGSDILPAPLPAEQEQTSSRG